jgi:hypothetical protein
MKNSYENLVHLYLSGGSRLKLNNFPKKIFISQPDQLQSCSYILGYPRELLGKSGHRRLNITHHCSPLFSPEGRQ